MQERMNKIDRREMEVVNITRNEVEQMLSLAKGDEIDKKIADGLTRREAFDQLNSEILKKLLEQEHRFKSVFTTGANHDSDGSIYLALDSGEIVRCKLKRESTADKPIPKLILLKNHHILLSAEETAKLNNSDIRAVVDQLWLHPVEPVLNPEIGGSVIDFTDEDTFMNLDEEMKTTDPTASEKAIALQLPNKQLHRSSTIQNVIKSK